MAMREPGLAGRAATEGATFLQQRRSRGTMNGAVDAAATQQRGIRGIHDSVDLKVRYVALNDFHPADDVGSHAASRPATPIAIE
jgi:hypothetical protein